MCSDADITHQTVLFKAVCSNEGHLVGDKFDIDSGISVFPFAAAYAQRFGTPFRLSDKLYNFIIRHADFDFVIIFFCDFAASTQQ